MVASIAPQAGAVRCWSQAPRRIPAKVTSPASRPSLIWASAVPGQAPESAQPEPKSSPPRTTPAVPGPGCERQRLPRAGAPAGVTQHAESDCGERHHEADHAHQVQVRQPEHAGDGVVVGRADAAQDEPEEQPEAGGPKLHGTSYPRRRTSTCVTANPSAMNMAVATRLDRAPCATPTIPWPDVHPPTRRDRSRSSRRPRAAVPHMDIGAGRRVGAHDGPRAGPISLRPGVGDVVGPRNPTRRQ